MRRNTAALVSIMATMMLLITFSPMVPLSNATMIQEDLGMEEGTISGDVLAFGDHSSFDGSTSWEYGLSSMSDIDSSTNIELVNGEVRPLLNASLISPVLKKITTNYEHVQAFSGGRATIARHGDMVFWAYTWKNGSNCQASLITSYDHGNTWTSPVDIYKGSTDGMRTGVYVWKDTLFYFVNNIPSSITSRILYVKQAPVSNWISIRTATLTTLLNNRATGFDVASDDNNVYLAVQRTSEMESFFYYFNGASWSSGVQVAERGHCARVSIEAVDYGGNTRVLMFYSRPWVTGALTDGDLHMKYSTNLGSTWSSEINVMDDENDYMDIDAVNMNGTVVMVSSHRDIDDIEIVISRDGGSTWSNEHTIVSGRGANTLHSTSQNDFTVNMIDEDDRVCVSYETSAQDIDMVYSDDYGSNWLAESSAVQIEPVKSYDPKLCPDSDLVTYVFDLATDRDIRFRTLTSYEPTSSFLLTECSPPMLSSWNSIGFDVSIANRTYVHYRVLDGETGAILKGWTNLSSKTSGMINGMSFNKTDTFTGAWAGSNLASSIQIEVRSTSLGMMHPSVWGVYLDYTTALPYNEDFSDLLGIEDYDCSFEPGWMNFSGRGRSEFFTTEPIELENGASWPDALLLDVYNLDSSNNIMVGIIDPSTDFYVTGFTTKDCTLINQPSSEKTTIVTWGSNHLKDLPSTLRSIQLDFMITSNPNQIPPSGVHRIWMADNMAPEVIGFYADPSWSIFRTEWIEISVWVDDDLEMPTELDCRLFHKVPGSSDWTMSYLTKIGAVGSLHYWNLSIPAGAPIGEWEIMVNVADSLGETSGDVVSDDTIWVNNNRPTPPVVGIAPGDPLTMDDLTATITTPGTDVELYEEELKYKYEWFINSELFRTEENITEYSSVLRADETIKGNEWMVKVYTWDGVEFSDPAMASVSINNTVPFVNGTFGPYNFDEDVGTAVIDMHSMFVDMDMDGLEFMVQLDVPYSFEIMTGDILHIQIPENWFGNFMVNVSVTDGELWNETFFDVIIEPVNDLPILNESDILVADEDEWFNTTFSGYDPADGDEITFSIEAYKDIPGLVNGENFFFYPNGSFHILPTNSMVGNHTFNLTVDDGNGGIVWMNVTLIVKNVNDAPVGTLNGPTENQTIEVGTEITFNATGFDIDGDDLEIYWVKEGVFFDETIGYGEVLVYNFTEEGSFNITCFISDGEEDIEVGTVMISVFVPVPDNTAPYGLTTLISPDTTLLEPFYALQVTSDWMSYREVPFDVPITLSASAMDGDDDDLTYTWTMLEDPDWKMTGKDITIPADSLVVGTYTFKVTVDDGNNHTIDTTLDPILVTDPDADLEAVAEALAWITICMLGLILAIILIPVIIIVIVILVRKKKGSDGVKEMPKSDIVEVGAPLGAPQMLEQDIVSAPLPPPEMASPLQAPPEQAPLPPAMDPQGYEPPHAEQTPVVQPTMEQPVEQIQPPSPAPPVQPVQQQATPPEQQPPMSTQPPAPMPPAAPIQQPVMAPQTASVAPVPPPAPAAPPIPVPQQPAALPQQQPPIPPEEQG